MPDDVDTDTPDSVIQSRLSKERQASYGSHIKRQTESIARLRSSLETARRDEEGQQARVKGLREMEHMTDDLVNKKLAVKGRLLDVRARTLIFAATSGWTNWSTSPPNQAISRTMVAETNMNFASGVRNRVSTS